MSGTNTIAAGGGTVQWLWADSLGNLYVRPYGYPEVQAEETSPDGDKTITVPAGEEWVVEWLYVEYTSDANAGNRQLEIQVLDGAADVIAILVPAVTQAASLTYYYLFAPNVTELTALRDTDKLSTIMPRWVLPAGYAVRVYDNNTVSAAGDTANIQMQTWVREVS